MGYEIKDVEQASKSIYELSNKLADISNHIKVEVRKNPFLVCVVFFTHPCWGSREMCGFTLTEQPNCCGVLVSTRTFVDINHQKQGLAQAMMPLKEAIAKEFRYSSLVATVNISGNPAEVHILNKFGWQQGHTFINSRTGNTVAFFHKALNV